MKILGLDLGVGSVGWALIEVDNENNPIEIVGMGSRVISSDSSELSDFSKGKGETACSKRTTNRGARRGLDRYKRRRDALRKELTKCSMLDTNPDSELAKLSTMSVWQLRADAATPGHKLNKEEIGRVLLHINQRRGYRHVKADDSDSKQRNYVKEINSRFDDIEERDMTVGQYFATELKKSEKTFGECKSVVSYRIKEKVFPRRAYEEEFDKIMQVQRGFYPEYLTDEYIKKLRDIIFYQRPLKSCKNLVNICDFQKLVFRNKAGKDVEVGPKVTPVSSPFNQAARIWESINNITLENENNKRRNSKRRIKECTGQLSCFDDFESESRLLQAEYKFTSEERDRLFYYLWTHEKMTEKDLLKALNLKEDNGFEWKGAPINGLKGNNTYVELKKALAKLPDSDKLLRFVIKNVKKVDRETGEEICEVEMLNTGTDAGAMVAQYTQEPLYKLWHTVYSAGTRDELAKAAEKMFDITDSEVIDKLYKIDFVKQGYSNRSAKLLRKIFPYLQEGRKFSEACNRVGVNHSGSLTKAENEARQLKSQLENLKKGSLRQPVVEKMINQMINIFNAIKNQYGEIDEIRVELARELKKSKAEREKMTLDISKRNRENESYKGILGEFNLPFSGRNILKRRLLEETGRSCIYCGKTVNMDKANFNNNFEIEHIIPRSIYFDDGFANKVCSCRDCNKEKGNRTAYDYMSSKGDEELKKYKERVDEIFGNKSNSRKKRKYLLMRQEDIPTDFIDRDLRLSQYIARKSREILLGTCRNVYASSGLVTNFFRHIWGYDEILHDLNVPIYERANLIETNENNHGEQCRNVRKIKDWNKRLDHRHHAIDALVIALTRDDYVKRLNNLNAEHSKMYEEIKEKYSDADNDSSLLEKWAKQLPHFTFNEVKEKVDEIAVSLKSGGVSTSRGSRFRINGGRREKVQQGIIVPRGALHNDTIYGKVKLVKKGMAVEKLLECTDSIVNQQVRAALMHRIEENDGDIKLTKKSLKKSPLIVTIKGKEQTIEKADQYVETYATRKKLTDLTQNAIDNIIDEKIKEEIKNRIEQDGGLKKFQQSLGENPLEVGGKVKTIVNSVRVKESADLLPVRKDGEGKVIGYAKPDNNHHVAFYKTPDGSIEQKMVTFWNVVMRERYRIPAIVKDPDGAWKQIEALPESLDKVEIAGSLPLVGSVFEWSMQRGEMFILGLSAEEFNEAINNNNKKLLASHLYRVQKISDSDYNFRLHTWSSVDTKKEKQDIDMKALYRIRSIKALKEINPIKVRVGQLGDIIKIDNA